MAIAFRAVGTLAKTANGLAGLAVPYPAGIVAGDLLIMQVSTGTGSANALNVPSGWTNVFGPVTGAGASGQAQYVLRKIASGSESGTLTITCTQNSVLSAIMSAYSGCDTTTPVDVFVTANLPTSGTTGTCPSVTTTGANRQILHMYWDWSNTGTVTQNAADAERYDTFDNIQNYITELADNLQTTAGATGTSAVTFSTAMSGGLCATIALAPIATVVFATHSALASDASQRAPAVLQAQSGRNDSPYLAMGRSAKGAAATQKSLSLNPDLARRAKILVPVGGGGSTRPGTGQVWPRHKRKS